MHFFKIKIKMLIMHILDYENDFSLNLFNTTKEEHFFKY